MKKLKKITLLSFGALTLLGGAVAAVAVACNDNKKPSSEGGSNSNTTAQGNAGNNTQSDTTGNTTQGNTGGNTTHGDASGNTTQGNNNSSTNENSELLLGSEIALEAAKTSTPSKGENYVLQLTDKNSEFMDFFIDPYKAFVMFAKSLDTAGYKISSHEPLKNSGFDTFEKYAKDVVEKVKAYVKAVAELPTIKKLRDENKTVLFAENNHNLNATDASLLDKYYYQQSDLFPILYSTPDNAVPGFGLKFPKPNDHKSDHYFDNWHGIGASQNNATGNSGSDAWRAGLYASYDETTDFMFYNYDSNKLASGVSKEMFEKFFKEKVKNNKVLLSDFQMDYSAIWGVVGQVELAQSFAKKLGVSDEELKTVESKKWMPPKTQAHIRPADVTGDKVKIAVTFYSVWDHIIALGIAPDYSIPNDEKGSTYPQIAGVFDKYYTNKSLTTFDNFQRNDAKIKAMNLYAIASNESHVSSRGYQPYVGNEIPKTVLTERGDTDKTRSPNEFMFYNRKENTLEKAVEQDGAPNRISSFGKPAKDSGSH